MATYATAFPSASRCHAHSCCDSPHPSSCCAAARRFPAASVVRSTVDAATCTPASLGNTFVLASAKLLCTPATQTTSAAAGLKFPACTPTTASQGQKPCPHAAQ